MFKFSAAALLAAMTAVSFSPSKTPVAPDGTRATVDLPASQHMRNTGGIDGLGLCVFTSIEHAGRWQNLVDLEDYRRWMERQRGGGWPEKVDKTLAQYCREKGCAVPEYVQHTVGDAAFLDLAIKTGRCPCVTYAGQDDFYRGGIDHMVNLAFLDQKEAAIIDNNRPGTWLWMTRGEFLQRWRARGGGWAFVFLGPPPPPHNGEPVNATEERPPGKIYGQQWGGGACPAPAAGQPLLRPLTNPFAVPDDLAGWSRSGRLWVKTGVGAYDPGSGKWAAVTWNGRFWSWGEWGPVPKGVNLPTAATACDCPCCKPNCTCEPGKKDPDCECYPCPAAGGREAATPSNVQADEPLTGVVPEKIHESPPYSINGRPVTQAEAHAALGGPLVDDSGKWNLAVVGSTSFLSKVRADLSKLTTPVRDKFHVQFYGPGSWAVDCFKLGNGVTLRKEAGLSRVSADSAFIAEKDYNADALNKMCPFTPPTPEPKPDPAKPDQPQPQPKQPSTVGGWIVLALLAVLAIFRRKQ